MPGILNRPLTHRFKPPTGSGLHRTHPLTVGMCGAYLLNDGGANAQFDNYARNVGHLSQSIAGYQGGKVGPNGVSVGTDGTGLLIGANPLGASSNVSIACRFRVTAAPSGQQGVYSIGTVKDDGSPLFVLDTNAGGTLLQSLIGDDAFSTIIGTLVVGQWYTHVATWGPTGGTQAEYIGYGANAMQIISRTYTLNAVNSVSVFLGSGYANPLASDFEFLYLWNRVLKYREALDLIADPYQMWDYRASRAVKKPSAGGNVTATPGILALTLTKFAPTVLAPRLCTPGKLSLTLTTFAPVIKLAVIPPTKALALTTFAPTVSTPRLCTPGKLSLSLTTFAPTAAAPRLCTPGKLSLTIASFAPTVSTPRLATPGTPALTLTRFAPTALTPRLTTPGTTALHLTTFAPVFSSPNVAVPSTVSLSLSTFAPTVSASSGRIVTPSTRALAVTLYAPIVSATLPVIYARARTWSIDSRLAMFAIAGRTRSYAITSRTQTWRIPAMGFPLLGQKLDPIFQGDAITQPITLTIAVGSVPDPNTWANVRLSITPQSGDSITVALADMTTPPAITGTGPWTVVLLFPISEAQSRELPAATCTFQVDVGAAGGGQALLVEGLIAVKTPSKALP